jgi:hypothetical protein
MGLKPKANGELRDNFVNIGINIMEDYNETYESFYASIDYSIDKWIGVGASVNIGQGYDEIFSLEEFSYLYSDYSYAKLMARGTFYFLKGSWYHMYFSGEVGYCFFSYQEEMEQRWSDFYEPFQWASKLGVRLIASNRIGVFWEIGMITEEFGVNAGLTLAF